MKHPSARDMKRYILEPKTLRKSQRDRLNVHLKVCSRCHDLFETVKKSCSPS